MWRWYDGCILLILAASFYGNMLCSLYKIHTYTSHIIFIYCLRGGNKQQSAMRFHPVIHLLLHHDYCFCPLNYSLFFFFLTKNAITSSNQFSEICMWANFRRRKQSQCEQEYLKLIYCVGISCKSAPSVLIWVTKLFSVQVETAMAYLSNYLFISVPKHYIYIYN